jgi:primosomal protein N''
MVSHTLFLMKSNPAAPTPDHLLAQIAAINRMEAGKISAMRRDSGAIYYNLQHREDGKNHTQYIPKAQLDQTQAHVAAYEQFTELVDQYVSAVSAISRQERRGEIKKKNSTKTSPLPKKSKSKN